MLLTLFIIKKLNSMKQNISILFLMIFFTVGSLFSIPLEKESPRLIVLQKRKAPDAKEPKIAFICPVTATVNCALVTATFDVDMDVTITITSVTDNSIAYYNLHSVTSGTILSIYLDNIEFGDYVIEFTYNNTTWFGTFLLNPLY